MRQGKTIGVVIPALDEALAIGLVVAAVPDWVDRIVVADNGSRDDTANIARQHGAIVIEEPARGYGAACLAGIVAVGDVDVIVFMDGDNSDDPSEMATLVDPILAGRADFVVGSRKLGRIEPGGLTPQQIFGNALACWLMARIWGRQHTDLGPFRAIRRPVLESLGMQDRDFGWTVEMQIEAAVRNVPTTEVPVRTRRRIGRSKISGTVSGVVLAGNKILFVIARSGLRDWRRRRALSQRDVLR
jgi:glycosyltransferase involved in cell wall biosynthesis